MKSIRMSEEYDLPFHACINNSHIGMLSNIEGKYDEALVCLKQAKEQYHRTRFIGQYVTQIFPDLAEAFIMKYISPGGSGWNFFMKSMAARKLCRMAIRKTKPWITHYGDALRVFALYYQYSGKYKMSERYFKKCLALQKRLNRRYKLARGLLDYGIFLNMTERDEEANINLNRASRIFDEIGCELFKDKALNRSAVKKDSSIALGMQDLISRIRYEQAISIAQEIKAINNHEELFTLIFNRCMEIIGAQRSFYYRRKDVDPDFELIYSKVIGNADKEFSYIEIIKKTINSANPLININYKENPDKNNSSSNIDNEYSHSFVCVPVISGGTATGACYFDNVLAPGIFNKGDADLIVTFITQAAPLFAETLYDMQIQPKKFSSGASGREKTFSEDNNEKLGLSIKEDGKYHIIPFGNIIYALSSGKHAIIYTNGKAYKASLLLSKIEDMLPKNIFMRIHKQYIVNMNHISYIEYYLGNRYAVHLTDEDDTVLISCRSYSSQLKTRLIHQ